MNKVGSRAYNDTCFAPQELPLDNVSPYPHKAALALTFRVSYKKYLPLAACELRKLKLSIRTEPGLLTDHKTDLLQSWLPFSTKL